MVNGYWPRIYISRMAILGESRFLMPSLFHFLPKSKGLTFDRSEKFLCVKIRLGII